MRQGNLTKRARHLRKTMTLQEVRLWVQLQHLNARGYHFRRQVPLDGYIVDFAEFRHRILIEVDGSQHGMPDGEARDMIRDRHFAKHGFTVLRFWNIDVNTELDGVVRRIEEALRNAPSGPSGHLPRKGGGNKY